MARSHKARTSVPLTKDEIEQIVQKSIATTLSTLGLHIKTDEEVDELRADLAYTRAWRKAVQKGTRTGWVTVVTVAVTGFLSVLAVAAKIALTGHV